MRKKGLLFASLVLLSACGGGGGGGTTTSSQPLSLYFTDDMSGYSSVVVKVYEVNLCSDNQCQQKVKLYSNPQGLSIDLAKLNGVLHYLNTTNVPQGTYNRLEVVLDKNLTITDPQGQNHQAVFAPMDEKPNKPNTVQCPTQNQCYIRFNGIVQPFAMGKMAVDFVLKEFEVNTSKNPWEVYEVKMKPLTPSELSQYSYYKLYGTVQSVNTQNNSFTISWRGNTYTVSVNQNTSCEFNNQELQGAACMSYIQTNMCVEVKTSSDPSTNTTLNAVKIEKEDECGG